MPYLILSVIPPIRRNLLNPLSLFDLGHIDVLLWDPPGAPESFGYYVAPATKGRVFLSVFLPQQGRLVVGGRFSTEPSYWSSWALSVEQLLAVRAYLEKIRVGCIDGRTRYAALFFNCFHLALACLRAAGLRFRPVKRHWLLLIPTLSARSFFAGPLANARYSRMETDLQHNPRLLEASACAQELCSA